MKEKTYLIGSFYILCLVYLYHFMWGEDLLKFYALYANIGIYFSSIIILSYGFSYAVKDIPFFKQISLNIKNNIGLLLMFAVVFSHILSLSSPLNSLVYLISSNLNINIYVSLFIYGLFVFLIGIFLLNKFDKKMIFISMGILFVYGSYFFISWNSLSEQRNIYVKNYSVAVNNEIKLKECSSSLLCIKINVKNFDQLNLPNTPENKEIHKKINFYLTDFVKKINKSEDKIVTFSYLDNLTTFIDDDYKPIGVYNKEKEYLIVDFNSFTRIQKNGMFFYRKLTGTSSFLWMCFLHLLIFSHFLIKLQLSKKKKNELI